MNTMQVPSQAVDTATPAPLHPQPAASVCVTNEPSRSNYIQLLPTVNMPKSDEDWEADNTSLGSTLVPQVLAAQLVEEKNMVLCVGIYNYFSSKYGLRKACHSRESAAKRHNRAFRRLPQEKNVIDALASAHISTATPRLAGHPHKHPCVSEAGPEKLNKRLHLLDQRTQRQCVGCQAAGRKTRPVYYCKTCPDVPQLCPTECFKRYHTLPKF